MVLGTGSQIDYEVPPLCTLEKDTPARRMSTALRGGWAGFCQAGIPELLEWNVV